MQITRDRLNAISEAVTSGGPFLWAAIAGEVDGNYCVHVVHSGAPRPPLRVPVAGVHIDVGFLEVGNFCGSWLRDPKNWQSVYVPHVLVGPDIAQRLASLITASNPGGISPGLLAQQAVRDASAIGRAQGTGATPNSQWFKELRQRALAAYIATERRLPDSSAALYAYVDRLTTPWALALRKATRERDDFTLATFQVEALNGFMNLPVPSVTMPTIDPASLGLAAQPRLNPPVTAPRIDPPTLRARPAGIEGAAHGNAPSPGDYRLGRIREQLVQARDGMPAEVRVRLSRAALSAKVPGLN